MTILPQNYQKVLLSSDNSRQNKIWLATGWQSQGYFIEWKWQDRPYFSRMLFKFSPDSAFKKAKSFDEDIFIHFLSDEPRKKDDIKKGK
jgi:hypothetical protein